MTLLVPVDRHANANGLVGTVQGIAFIVTSVFSGGLSIGLLGMGWTLAIAIGFTLLALAHLAFVRIPPEAKPERTHETASAFDLRGSIRAIRAAQGLFGLIVFSTFNNLIGGVYMALMDPYGLILFPRRALGGHRARGERDGLPHRRCVRREVRPRQEPHPHDAAARRGHGGLLGAFFTIRDWWWLYAGGIWLYMTLIPAIEAAEQTVIQKVVPYRTQGRVFGFAAAFEAAAAPVTAFLIAPPSPSSGSSPPTWTARLGRRHGAGCSATAQVAASRSSSSSRGSSWS